MDEHQSDYQRRDWEVVDYNTYTLPGTNLTCRGPRLNTLQEGQYIVCLGAAQTFGCFCKEAYPSVLSKQLSFPVLNLGLVAQGLAFSLRTNPIFFL